MIYLDAGYIHTALIKSRKAIKLVELVQGFQLCYDELKSRDIAAKMIRPDNKISSTIIAKFENQEWDYQLVSLGDYFVCQVEQTISTF